MEINEKELKDRRLALTREVEQLQAQLQQAQLFMQAGPQRIASRQGEMAGIDRILQKVNKPAKKKT